MSSLRDVVRRLRWASGVLMGSAELAAREALMRLEEGRCVEAAEARGRVYGEVTAAKFLGDLADWLEGRRRDPPRLVDASEEAARMLWRLRRECQ